MGKKDRDRRKRGLLRLFVLRTLTSEAKSGYDILKEIESKTQGEWKPSKGTIYPILSELEEGGLIRGKEEGPRSRTAYSTTEAGIKHLNESIEKERTRHRTRTAGRRILFEETFFEDLERELVRLNHRFMETAMESEDKEKPIRILRRALEELEDEAWTQSSEA